MEVATTHTLLRTAKSSSAPATAKKRADTGREFASRA
jgi:hypothetical protein